MKARTKTTSTRYWFRAGSLLGAAMPALCITATGAAHAQQKSLEELQKELDRAKKENARPKLAPLKQPSPATEATPISPNGIAPGSARLVEAGNRLLRDTMTGLVWTQADNGGDVNWGQAMAHCESVAGWRLPTVRELMSLYSESSSGAKCGGSTCKISSLFSLSSVWFWSNEGEGSQKARYVHLVSGDVVSALVGYASTGRALCVRRS